MNFGKYALVGQQRAREQAERILKSDRLSHAYLISGPPGVGKTAFALAFAEAINGIENLGVPQNVLSKKSSWFAHPDIHVFIPRPTTAGVDDLRERLELLAQDPYALIDYAVRPSLDGSGSKNKQAFYPVDYFRDEIRPVTRLTPNEGRRVIVIMTGIDSMRREVANAFLKVLEEPNDRLMFILTTSAYERLLQTITSRCQHIPLGSLSMSEIKEGLINKDGYDDETASYLSRVSGGNYAITRFYDPEEMKKGRLEVVEFMRHAYQQHAKELSELIQDWQSSRNIEGLVTLTNLLETYLRDLIIFRATGNTSSLINIDQADSIRRFTGNLKDARLDEMISEVERIRTPLRQNVNPKLLFTVLSLRMSALMHGSDPVIPSSEPWNHLPAFTS